MDVIGVGDIDVDIYLEVDHIPSRDEKLLAETVSIFPGGMVANFLVSLRRLGTDCGFHGLVGSDEFGHIAIEDLKANDVDDTYAVIKKNGQTYFCVVILDESGEKALIVAPTDCIALQEEDISIRAINSARHMHTIFHGPAQLKAIQIAHNNSLTISVDIEPDSVKYNNYLDEALSMIDVAFINQSALRYMSDFENLEIGIFDVISRGPKIVCLTLGRNGSLIASSSPKRIIRSKSFEIPVTDTTGAGDCFAAGFIHGYLKGWPLEFLGQFASATAALNIMKKGGHTGAPTFDEVIKFLEKNLIDIPKPYVLCSQRLGEIND